MSKHLRRTLHQLALRQVDHEARGGQPPHGFQGVLQHLLLRIPVNCDVVQIDDHWQFAAAILRMEHVLNYVLKVRRSLGQSHWHAEPAELPSVCHKSRIIRRASLKDNIVEPCFQVDH